MLMLFFMISCASAIAMDFPRIPDDRISSTSGISSQLSDILVDNQDLGAEFLHHCKRGGPAFSDRLAKVKYVARLIDIDLGRGNPNLQRVNDLQRVSLFYWKLVVHVVTCIRRLDRHAIAESVLLIEKLKSAGVDEYPFYVHEEDLAIDRVEFMRVVDANSLGISAETRQKALASLIVDIADSPMFKLEYLDNLLSHSWSNDELLVALDFVCLQLLSVAQIGHSLDEYQNEPYFEDLKTRFIDTHPGFDGLIQDFGSDNAELFEPGPNFEDGRRFHTKLHIDLARQFGTTETPEFGPAAYFYLMEISVFPENWATDLSTIKKIGRFEMFEYFVHENHGQVLKFATHATVYCLYSTTCDIFEDIGLDIVHNLLLLPKSMEMNEMKRFLENDTARNREIRRLQTFEGVEAKQN